MDRFLAFAFAHADLLIEVGSDGLITWAAGAFATRFGAPSDSFIGRRLSTLIAAADHPVLAIMLSTAALRGRLPPTVLRLEDAECTAVVMAALAIPGPTTRICVTIGPLASAPPKSPEGMQDRNAFTREVEARLRGGQAGGLGLFDIKGWDHVQAALSAEDRGRVLGQIGEVLLDAAGPGAVAGQIAEGRYAVLGQRDLDMPDLSRRLADVILDRKISHPIQVDGTIVPLSTDGLNAPMAVRALRMAMSQFAEHGSSAAAETEELRQGLSHYIAVAEARAGALQTTIAERRFQLAYQPIVSLASRRIHHYEALIRPIPTPSNPIRSPQDFVTMAESAGLAEELDCAVVERVLAVLNVNSAVSIAANISGLSMQSRPFRDRFMKLLATSKPDISRRLLVELTETAEVDDVATTAETLEQLRAMGIAVCIDDFGAGAAGFRYLRDFCVDYIKIDGAYVQSASRGERDRSFVASMVDLARSVNAKVVAEAIETEQQAQMMKELGIQQGQGWLFGRPGVLPGSQYRG